VSLQGSTRGGVAAPRGVSATGSRKERLRKKKKKRKRKNNNNIDMAADSDVSS